MSTWQWQFGLAWWTSALFSTSRQSFCPQGRSGLELSPSLKLIRVLSMMNYRIESLTQQSTQEHWLGQTFQNWWFCKVSNNLFSHCLKVKHAGVARADNRLQVQHHNLKRRVGKMSFSQVLEKNVSQVLFYSLEHQKPFQSWSGWRGSRAQSQGSHHSPRSPLPEKPGFNSWNMR